MLRRLALSIAAMVLPWLAWADCTNPADQAGAVVFSTTAKAMQYCNGTNWINAGPVIANAPQTGCTSPAGSAGHVIYNGALGVVQFCNGSSWINTACAAERSPNGSGCTGGAAGQIRYVGGTVNELQFCDSTNWVAMGYPCAAISYPAVAQVFSVDTYTGNGTSQTITTGVNLSSNGGLVWTKGRSNSSHNWLTDTINGAGSYLAANLTDPLTTGNLSAVSAFNSNGHSLGSSNGWNASTQTFVAWTFRKAPRFFDIVTWTGNGVAGSTIPHSLGISPGLVIVKSPSNIADWRVYHRSATGILRLNGTDAQAASHQYVTAVSAADFTVSAIDEVNGAGRTYVAYLFAHDPSPNGIIQCGSYVGTGANVSVNLGWQPQFLIIRAVTVADNWYMLDTARGWTNAVGDSYLYANLSNAENTSGVFGDPTSTGFNTAASSNLSASGQTYIYCAIRAEGS